MTATETVIRFTVIGRPQGKGSKRAMPIGGTKATGRRIVMVDSNKNARPWASMVSVAAHGVYGDRALIRGPVQVSMEFFFARPKAHFGRRGLLASAPAHMITMPDSDKLGRCALDALTGVVFKDDAQVCLLQLAKRYGEPERLEVRIREMAA